jgi:riboflavin biosynthesis pyrimidine reductase
VRRTILVAVHRGAAAAHHAGDPLTSRPDIDGPIPRLDALAPAGGALSARELVATLGLERGVGTRPRVVTAMIMSADGRAQLIDRAVGLGNPADRDLLRELRTAADAVLAGSTTLHAERYANLLDPGQRAYRTSCGLTAHPLVVTISRDLSIPADEIPLFSEEGVRVVVATESPDGDLGERAAEVEFLRYPPGGMTFSGLLGDLRARYGVRGVACEGGPHLLRELVAQDCVDDLLFTVAPKLVGGDRLSVMEGDVLAERGVDLELAGIWRGEDHVFLRYRRASS